MRFCWIKICKKAKFLTATSVEDEIKKFGKKNQKENDKGKEPKSFSWEIEAGRNDFSEPEAENEGEQMIEEDIKRRGTHG